MSRETTTSKWARDHDDLIKSRESRLLRRGTSLATFERMRTAALSPFRALFSGIVAGVAGSIAQNAFFALTKSLEPEPDAEAFTPPEPEQKNEAATQTVARRTVEELMQRGPLDDKERAGQIVHFAFGSAWGGIYGLVRGAQARRGGPLGAALFSALVWAVSDDFILPAFKLSAWPRAYPMKTHAYALAAHGVYGASVWATFEALRPRTTKAPDRNYHSRLAHCTV
jgi:hypothetical protein